MESRQAGARLPVLQHSFARTGGTDRHRSADHQGTRPRRRDARHSRRRARLAGEQDFRQMPELSGHFRVRRRPRRAAVRLLWFVRPRAVGGNQGRVSPGKFVTLQTQ